MKVLPLPCKWLDLCMAWVTMLLFSTEAPLGYTNKNFHPPCALLFPSSPATPLVLFFFPLPLPLWMRE